MSDHTTVGTHKLHPTLDGNVVEELEHLGEASGEDLLGELAAMFEIDADAQLAEMHRALDLADSSAVSRSAHNLSGASASLGASNLAFLCTTLEHESADGNLTHGESLLEAMEVELKLVHCEFALHTSGSHIA